MTSPRETILLRRARFCAIALAGVGLSACGDDGQAQPCLLTSLEDTEAAPEACLFILPDSALLDTGLEDTAPETRDDAADASEAPDATDATDTPSDGG